MEDQYKEYVELGKQVLNKVQDHQMKICEYAMKVCTIRHGGRSEGYYTIKNYADDIGMKYKTLQNWIQIYRNVVLKLNKNQRKNTDWQKASRVNNVLDESRTMDRSIDNIKGKNDRYKLHLPEEKVQGIYDKLMNQKPFETEFINMVQQAKYIRNLLDKRDLSIIDPKHMLHFMEILDECSDKINDFLTKKRKKVA